MARTVGAFPAPRGARKMVTISKSGRLADLKGDAVRDDPTVISLVARAGSGDQSAWNEIVERYAPLVWSICVRYQLRPPEVDDVGQTVWLLLVENIGRMREPAPGPFASQ